MLSVRRKCDGLRTEAAGVRLLLYIHIVWYTEKFKKKSAQQFLTHKYLSFIKTRCTALSFCVCGHRYDMRYFYWQYCGVCSFPVIILKKLMQVPWIPSKAQISLKGGEDEPTQGQTIHSSNCNQEEMLKPPFLCEGRAAQGLQGIRIQRLHQSHCFPASDIPLITLHRSHLQHYLHCILSHERCSVHTELTSISPLGE